MHSVLTETDFAYISFSFDTGETLVDVSKDPLALLRPLVGNLYPANRATSAAMHWCLTMFRLGQNGMYNASIPHALRTARLGGPLRLDTHEPASEKHRHFSMTGWNSNEWNLSAYTKAQL